MEINEYIDFVRKGNFTENHRDAKFLAAMGLCGEAGEVSEILKKHLLHGKPFDIEELKKELGDVLWYFFHTLNTFDLDIYEIIDINVNKLINRYPQYLEGDQSYNSRLDNGHKS